MLLESAAVVSWFGRAVFGISEDPQHDAASRTESERELAREYFDRVVPVPESGLVVGEIFGGGYCFLHSEESPRANQVSAHAPDELYAEVSYWRSFEDYLEYLESEASHKNWIEGGSAA